MAGTGKTTAAHALARASFVVLVDPTPSPHAILAWWCTAMPWRARHAALRVVQLVLTRLPGPLSARMRRAALLVRGLARLRLTRREGPFLFDEGPFTWTQSLQWRSDRDLRAVTDALIVLYRAAGARVAFVRLDPQERARRWSSREGIDPKPAPRANPSSPRHVKRPAEAREGAFELARARCHAVPGFAFTIDAGHRTPDEVARSLRDAWWGPARGQPR